jgi:hypothetical protein
LGGAHLTIRLGECSGTRGPPLTPNGRHWPARGAGDLCRLTTETGTLTARREGISPRGCHGRRAAKDNPLSPRKHAAMRDVLVIVRDDLDNDLDADHTRTFGLDGLWYEIDLAEEHSRELDEALARFRAVARPLKGGKKLSTQIRADKPVTIPAALPLAAAGLNSVGHERRPGRGWRMRVRMWAAETGHPLMRGSRGKLSAQIVFDYVMANRHDPPGSEQSAIHREAASRALSASAMTEPPAPPPPATADEYDAWRKRARAWGRKVNHPGLTPAARRNGNISVRLREDYTREHPADPMPMVPPRSRVKAAV